ncbi:MAG: leucine-rich repeat protein [Paramuribaculum sp.]|nr:leucine-rich repeat protein [Paramuribaculum sp.]
MKKLIAIFGLALSAIVLSNTLFAEKRVISKTIDQYHTAASNNITKDTARVKWYFIIDTDSLTATLTYPHDTEDITEEFNPDSVYTLTKLDNFPGWEGTWNQNMYNCWSPVIDNYYHNNKYSIATFYTAIQIPDSVEIAPNIKYPVTEIGDNAFNGSAIQYIDVPKTVKKIGDYAFANSKIIGQCEASPYQVIPDAVKNIGRGIFQNCKALTRIEFGDGVTVIPENTFDGCFVTDPNSPKFVKTLDIRFGINLDTIKCEIKAPKLENNDDYKEDDNKLMPKVRVAFSSTKVPEVDTAKFVPNQVWIPAGEEIEKAYKTTYDHLQDSVFYTYYISPEKDTYTIYSDQWLKLNFTQKSYFKNPNAVYNYIYYYPAGGGINFSVNALTGRGANKVRFRMLFDNLNAIDQANEVYQIIKQDIATSYSYIKYKYVGKYNVTLRSLDFTRAEANVSINVIPGVSATKINLKGVTKMVVGDSGEIEHLAVNNNSEVSTVQDVKWTSSNDSIAIVDENGIVTALSPGVVTITASSLDKYCPNAKGTLKITVTEPEQETQATPQANAIAIDSKINVSTNGTELTIRSNSPLGKVDIYSLDGRLVKSLNSSINVETVSLPSNGIYIVKTSTQTIKINL